MGIGPTALRLYEKIGAEYFEPGMSVCELGSQDFVPGKYSGPLCKFYSVRELYASFGISRYVCIDLNGEHDALKRDLNQIEDIGEDFDIVTNHGTSEHIFNQMNCFKFMHSLTKSGGLIIHIVPTQGYLRHGFFNYSPLLFEELSRANQYKIAQIYNEDDQFGTLMVVMLIKTEDNRFTVPMQIMVSDGHRR